MTPKLEAYGTVSDCSASGDLAMGLIATSNVTSLKVGEYAGLSLEYDIKEESE